MNVRRRFLALVVSAVAVVGLAACSTAPPAADDTVAAFLAEVGRGDTAAAAARTDQPTVARGVLDAARADLEAESVQLDLRQVSTSGDTASAAFDATWTLPQGRVWTYAGQVPLTRSADGWQVRWSSTVLHPQLAANQTLAVRTDAAPTATVLDRAGTPVLSPATLVRVTLDPVAAGDVAAVAGALGAALSAIDPAITGDSILAGVAEAPGRPYGVARLREVDYQSVKAAIYELPGVTFPTEAALLSPDRSFAPTLLSQVRERVQDQLDGTAGWRVVTVGPSGGDVAVLTETAPAPAPAVSLTLDAGVQSAAQDAVNAVTGKQVVVVALQASTGDVLAVAQNPEADVEGPIALVGQYPPGSTFKIVTASAALQAGTTSPDAAVECPGTTVVEQRRIPNYDGFALGTVPLTQAFARSCNTTFAQLATQLAPDGLTAAARQLGLGTDYAVDGITTFTGSVPPSEDVVTRAEDGFGQGDVLASPFGLALSAAAVASGATPTPTLIRGGAPTEVTDAPPAIPQPVLEGVRTMMRAVVTEGTATALADLGDVHGKTGEAQFGDGTRSHAWFVGYRGDLALATLVVDGGSSTNAVAVTRDLLTTLPPGY